MSLTASLNESITIGGTSVTGSYSYTDSAQIAIDESVADSVTDQLIALVLDVSEIAAILLISDQDVTLEFCNSGTGTPTMALKANKPYVWHTDSPYTNLLNVDITPGVYVTNASGSTAAIKIRALYDSTP